MPPDNNLNPSFYHPTRGKVSDITPATPLLDQPPPGKTAIADKLRC
jgi:hypothetical protein